MITTGVWGRQQLGFMSNFACEARRVRPIKVVKPGLQGRDDRGNLELSCEPHQRACGVRR